MGSEPIISDKMNSYARKVAETFGIFSENERSAGFDGFVCFFTRRDRS